MNPWEVRNRTLPHLSQIAWNPQALYQYRDWLEFVYLYADLKFPLAIDILPYWMLLTMRIVPLCVDISFTQGWCLLFFYLITLLQSFLIIVSKKWRETRHLATTRTLPYCGVLDASFLDSSSRNLLEIDRRHCILHLFNECPQGRVSTWWMHML